MSTTLQLPDQEHPMNEAWEIEARLGYELAAVVDGGPCALDSTSVVDLTGEAPVVARRALGDVSHRPRRHRRQLQLEIDPAGGGRRVRSRPRQRILFSGF